MDSKKAHPLTIVPGVRQDKVEYLKSAAQAAPLFLVDYEDDLGLPKGTAFGAAHLHPFSMGDEPFDGFMVTRLVPRDINLLVEYWTLATGQEQNNKTRRIYQGALNDCLHAHEPLSVDSLGAPHIQSFAPLTHGQFLSGPFIQSLQPFLSGALLTLKNHSNSKFAGLCMGSDGAAYLVVHSGVSNLNRALDYCVRTIIGREQTAHRIEHEPVNALAYLTIHLDPDTVAYGKVAQLYDIARRFAWLNRLAISHSIVDFYQTRFDATLMPLVQFHKEHACVEQRAEGGFWHYNSLNRLGQQERFGFITGDTLPSCLFEAGDALKMLEFYQHRLDLECDHKVIQSSACHGRRGIDVLHELGCIHNPISLTQLTRTRTLL
ncbi:hypothetical protein GNF76_05165 [Pseudomonas sp. CCM 7893]|uniref:Uncharacterized protein n=1 Tax=Pseudomonas spelaei TaxID=1055469 RepID=A0A6I3W727_9PSED|nr:hypothetical protein [Pseudomonas spelaei]MUF03711.1 hypothetical protein [Pseudomonas spelaei]